MFKRNGIYSNYTSGSAYRRSLALRWTRRKFASRMRRYAQYKAQRPKPKITRAAFGFRLHDARRVRDKVMA